MRFYMSDLIVVYVYKADSELGIYSSHNYGLQFAQSRQL